MTSGLLSRTLILAGTLIGVSGCEPGSSTTSHRIGDGMQPAGVTRRGTILCVREVVPAAGPLAAFRAASAGSGGTPIADHGVAFEYIVRRPDGDLVSVTQHDQAPLAVGQHVLVIAGNQARVVRN